MAWLAKAELVAKLNKIDDHATFIPLYLEGGAWSVYQELPEGKKNNAEFMKNELIKAFTDTECESFCKRKAVRWGGEAVDVYANEIRSLVRGCGIKDTDEKLARLVFIIRFQDNVSVKL